MSQKYNKLYKVDKSLSKREAQEGPTTVALADIDVDPAGAKAFYLSHIQGVHHCLAATLGMARQERERLMQVVSACRYQRLLTDGFLDVALQLYRQAEKAGIDWSERSVNRFVRHHHPLNQKDGKITCDRNLPLADQEGVR